jgi:nucleotide-binding universal stress UspA family protein
MSVGASLATQLNAKVIGIVVSQPLLIAAENIYVPSDVFDEHKKNTEARMDALKDSFSQAMMSQLANFEWHSKITVLPTAQYIERFSRSVDILVASIQESHGVELGDETTSDIAGDLVIQSGRPVLLVPDDTPALNLHSALICWRDTRESRRAVSDAIPLLQKCLQVRLLELCDKDQQQDSKKHLAHLINWLSSHDIHATADSLESNGNEAEQLQAYASQHEVDLLIGGAFGHSRIREWMFGGVTRNLFFHGAQCALVSH